MGRYAKVGVQTLVVNPAKGALPKGAAGGDFVGLR